MAKDGFEIGDIVQLKSGGPQMTITETKSPLGEKVVQTTWFAGSKKESGYFPLEALMSAGDE